MTKNRLRELKNLLRESQSHHQMKKFFQEHLMRSPELRKASRPFQDEVLETMVQMTVWQMLGPVELSRLKMQRADEYHLTYGEFEAGPHRGEFFFYDKADAGVAWLHNSSACMRFRMRFISEAEAMQRLGQAV